ncbi:alpha/beta hydrolase domain-containing protein [Rhodococcus baikonurensis]|uniref:alpha/beta hydrolase domain-containing protein n=1 Tax=Rhodococcus baikonurensis TaxID=172041 RepID=UPI0037AF1072
MIARWAVATLVVVAVLTGTGSAQSEPLPLGNAVVDGPIPSRAVGSQSRDYPFGASIPDIADRGYAEEEFFFSGETLAGPYTSRMLVRRPTDPEKFSGTVVTEWTNVSNNFDFDCLWARSADHLIHSGDAYVAVDAQTVGIENPDTGLKAWNPQRYARLELPSVGAFVAEPAAYEIFGQALQQIRTPTEVAPLGELEPRQQIATGCSQSAGALSVFANTVGPLYGAVDGYLLAALSSASIGPDRPSIAIPQPVAEATNIPVLQLNTETDLSQFRSPDSDSYRLWEVAGTTHSDLDAQTYLENIARRDLGLELGPYRCAVEPLSRIPFKNAQNAALEALKKWADGGSAPTSQPTLLYAADGAPVRDEYGNALGGIRLPEFAVPTATNSRENSGPDVCGTLFGSSVPFTTELVRFLYPTASDYMSQFENATTAAVDAGVLLPDDARAGEITAGLTAQSRMK